MIESARRRSLFSVAACRPNFEHRPGRAALDADKVKMMTMLSSKSLALASLTTAGWLTVFSRVKLRKIAIFSGLFSVSLCNFVHRSVIHPITTRGARRRDSAIHSPDFGGESLYSTRPN